MTLRNLVTFLNRPGCFSLAGSYSSDWAQGTSDGIVSSDTPRAGLHKEGSRGRNCQLVPILTHASIITTTVAAQLKNINTLSWPKLGALFITFLSLLIALTPPPKRTRGWAAGTRAMLWGNTQETVTFSFCMVTYIHLKHSWGHSALLTEVHLKTNISLGQARQDHRAKGLAT